METGPTQAETHNRQQYEGEIISLFARMGRREPAIPDADVSNEYEAARRFYAALNTFRKEARGCAELSPIKHDALIELLDGLEDLTPDPAAWEEKVSDAQRGYE